MLKLWPYKEALCFPKILFITPFYFSMYKAELILLQPQQQAVFC